MSRHSWVFLGIIVLFVLALLVVFPIDKGVILGRPIRLGLDLQGGTRITYKADLHTIPPAQQGDAIKGAIAVLENRLNPLGVTESSIRAVGNDEIVVEIPGKTLTSQEKDNLAQVALLEFGELVTDNGTYKWKDQLGNWKPSLGTTTDNQTLELTSSYFLNNTYVTTGNLGQVLLIFNWDATGSQLSQQITTRLYNNSNAPLGIFEGGQPLLGEDGVPIAPKVNGIISDKGQIEGLSGTEARRLSEQLNAGRLPVPLSRTGDEQDIEPSLGTQFVNISLKAGAVALAVVIAFMIAYYRFSGVIAAGALLYYAVLLAALFKLLNVTMTLSAIGGFVLSLGMAVDANVLIFERMKEELWGGRTLGAAIDAGFNRAWPAIWDSNITTILAGVILLWLGSSNIASSAPVKGFAVTLIIGVASSMFTAITVTRTLLRPFATSEMAANVSLFSPFQRKKSNG